MTEDLDALRRRVQEAEHERNLLMVTLDEAHEDLAKAGLGPSLLNDRIRTLIAERDAARQRADAAEAQVRELEAARRVAWVAEVVLRAQRELITPENNEFLWHTLEVVVQAWRAAFPSDYAVVGLSQLEWVCEQANAALARLDTPPQEPTPKPLDPYEAEDWERLGLEEAAKGYAKDEETHAFALMDNPYFEKSEALPPQEPQASGPCRVHQLHGIGAVFAATPWVVRMGQRDVAFCVEQADAHTIAALLNKGGQP